MPATTLADRSVVRLSGENVRNFLNGLVTSDVTSSLPVWTGLLTPQGKCLFDFLVWADDEDILLDCEAEVADELIRKLGMYRLRRPIEISLDGSLAVHWSKQGSRGVADPRLADLGYRWLAPPGESVAGYREHRLGLGVCEGRSELGDLLWLECNAAELHGVSFTKGCFVGQENTARMNWRQKVNRRLFVIAADKVTTARVTYPAIGLAVIHSRIDALPQGALIPEWLSTSLIENPR